jgi:hypothetical protein
MTNHTASLQSTRDCKDGAQQLAKASRADGGTPGGCQAAQETT